MDLNSNGSPARPDPESELVKFAALLLRVNAYERRGLPYRAAVLAAASELKCDPGLVIRSLSSGLG